MRQLPGRDTGTPVAQVQQDPAILCLGADIDFGHARAGALAITRGVLQQVAQDPVKLDRVSQHRQFGGNLKLHADIAALLQEAALAL